jgi:hypothetical protein
VKPDNVEICTAETQEVARPDELELERKRAALENFFKHCGISTEPFSSIILQDVKKQMVRVPGAA